MKGITCFPPLSEPCLDLLLLEHSPDDARLLQTRLQESEMETSLRWEESLAMGLDVLEDAAPDVVVLDPNLAGSEGVNAVERCAEAAPSVPVVVLAGQEDVEAVRAFKEAGATDYLRKDELQSDELMPRLLTRTLQWAIEQASMETELSEMEAELTQKEARIRSITENVSEGIYRSTPDSIVHANQALAEMFGYENPEECLEVDPASLYAESGRRNQLEKILKEEGGFQGKEIEFRRKDGSTFTGLLSGTTVWDEDGKVEYYDGTVIDLSDRKEWKQELERQNDLFAKTQDLADVGAWEYDAGADELYLTEKVSQIYGLAPDASSSLAKSFELYHPDDRPKVEEAFRRALEDGDPYDLEVRLHPKGGEERWVHEHGEPPPEDETEDRIRGTLQDITERKRREKRLRETSERLQAIIESSPVAILAIDLEGNVERWTPAATRIFGWEEEEVLGNPLPIVPDSKREEFKAFRDRISKGEVISGREITRQDKKGRPVHLQLFAAPVHDSEGTVTGIMAALEDITEWKEQEQIRQDRRKKIEVLYGATERLLKADDLCAVGKEIHKLLNETFDHPLIGVSIVEDGMIVPERIQGKEGFDLPPFQPLDLHGEGLGAQALRSGEPVVAEDLANVENEVDYGDLRSAVCIPVGEQAVFFLGRAEAGGFDAFDLHLLDILATHATVVLDRIEQMEALREERDLLDRLFETSPVAILRLNREGEFVRVNGRAEEVLGLEKSKMADRTYSDSAWNIEAPDGRPLSDEELPATQVLSKEKPVHNVEMTIERPDGSRPLLSVSGAPLYTAEGELEGGVFHVDDITKEREAKRALRESERKFRKLFEEAPIGIALTTPGGQVIETNPAFQKILGHDVETLQGSPLSHFTYEDDVGKDRSQLEDLVAGECSAYTVQKRYRRGNGEVFWARLTTSLLKQDDDTPVLMCMIEDIDAQKQHEQELRAAKEEAERMNRLKSAFLANMSHEIRTPLTSILGFAEAIGEETEDGSDDAVARFSDLIQKSGRRLMSTLTGVLNFSKLEAGEMDLSSEPVELTAEAEDIAKEFKPQVEEAGIDLHVKAGDDPVWAQGDEGGIQIALRNLVQNAVKYTEEGGQVWIRARGGKDATVLEVEDTGIGMDPSEAEKLFEPFRQESEGITREYEGTGLGLAVTKKVLDRMDGTIEVETKKEEGTRFTIRLPRVEAIEIEDR